MIRWTKEGKVDLSATYAETIFSETEPTPQRQLADALDIAVAARSCTTTTMGTVIAKITPPSTPP